MPAANKPIDVIIYHNPECGTSRNTLGLIRNAGIEPHVIEYLKTPAEPRFAEIADRTHGHLRARRGARQGHALSRA